MSHSVSCNPWSWVCNKAMHVKEIACVQLHAFACEIFRGITPQQLPAVRVPAAKPASSPASQHHGLGPMGAALFLVYIHIYAVHPMHHHRYGGNQLHDNAKVTASHKCCMQPNMNIVSNITVMFRSSLMGGQYSEYIVDTAITCCERSQVSLHCCACTLCLQHMPWSVISCSRE